MLSLLESFNNVVEVKHRAVKTDCDLVLQQSNTTQYVQTVVKACRPVTVRWRSVILPTAAAVKDLYFH